MSRPRTKGEAVTIRLSRHHDELLRLAAEQAGIPAGQMATVLLEGALEPPPKKRSGRPAGRAVHAETCKCSMCAPAKAKA